MAVADFSASSSHPSRDPFWLRALFAVPLLGWMLKDALHGGPEAGRWFAFNIVALIVGSIAIWGYPVLITLALAATATMLTVLVLLTRGG